MQSFRQYKQFRRAVETQIGRDKEKVRGLARGNEQQLPSRDQLREPDTTDVEKIAGDGSPASSASESTVVADHAPSPQPPAEEAEEPSEEEEGEGGAQWVTAESFEHRPTNLSRMPTERSGHSNLSRMGTSLGAAMTGVDMRKRNTEEGGEGNVFVVGYEGEADPLNPHSWGMARRIFITIVVASIGFVVGVASAIDSPVTARAAMEFHVSDVVEVMATGEFTSDEIGRKNCIDKRTRSLSCWLWSWCTFRWTVLRDPWS